MPWTASDARRHTRKARTPNQQRAWAHAANSVLRSTGDEGRAVRAGNAAAARASAHGHDRRGKRKSRRRGRHR